MSLIWVIYKLLKNPSVIDVSWSLGLMTAGLIFLWSQSITLRNAIISTLLILWSLRLAAYLCFTRIRKKHIDKRYIELSNTWKINKSLGFFLNFQLQGLLIFIISLVFFFISNFKTNSLSFIDIIACIVVTLGIIGESLADIQLQQFKSVHKRQVCNVGLWAYSRHPNYFFDWLTWCGFTLFSLRSNYGYFGVISVWLLYFIFNYITGPMTERGSIQSRGQAYMDYQKTTPMFFLKFKKKANSELKH